MKLTRIHTAEDGKTRFEDREVTLHDAGAIGALSEDWPAGAVVFRQTQGDYDYDWHPAPRRQLVVLLDGQIEITVGSGEVRTFGPGELLLLEDTAGQGHKTRQLTAGPRRSLFITLPPEVKEQP